MNWYERRARLIEAAAIAPAYGTPRLPTDRHIGRVLMFKKYGFRAGFWPTDHGLAGMIEKAFERDQHLRTNKLPKL